MTFVSIVMNTARSGYAITHMPETHHFQYTIDSLLRHQTYKNFELIISDCLWPRHDIDWKTIAPLDFPIYHVPVEHSVFKNKGYCAICATKNNGIMYSSGDYVVSLDDCCSGPPSYISEILRIWKITRAFPNPLHRKLAGIGPQVDGSGNQVRDCRFQILDQRNADYQIGGIHGYGYMTYSMEAALRLNGFDEMLDGSKQMEDQDFSERLHLAGYQVSIHRDLTIDEQEHRTISKTPMSERPGDVQDVIEFQPNLKCNGTFYFLRQQRFGKDAVERNRRGLNPEEARLVKPCYKLDMSTGIPRCSASGRGCNWMEEAGGKYVTKHMVLPDSNMYFSNPPVFDLAAERQARLAKKENYRVL